MISFAAAQVEARPGRLRDAVEAHVQCAVAAAGLGARLLVFPELSLTSYDRALTPADALDITDFVLRPLAVVARKLGITLVVGAPAVGVKRLMIASLCFFHDGRVATYTKKHLHQGEEGAFEAGDGGALLDVDETQVGLAICAEINQPAHVAEAVARGAGLYAASCFFTPRGYSNDCRMLQGHAASHRVAVAMANYTGPSGGFESAGGSAIWDNTGALVAQAPADGEYLVVATAENDGLIGRCVRLGVS
jgi:predicted amidohydrolase